MRKNKTLIIVLIIVLSFLCALLAGIMIIGITGKDLSGYFVIKRGKYSLALEKKFEENCDFVIESGSSDIKINVRQSGESNCVRIYNKKNMSTIGFDRKICRISSKDDPKPLNFDFRKSLVEIEIPEDYGGKITIKNDSGDVFIGDFENLVLEADLDSGNLNTGIIKTANIKADSSNLDIKQIIFLKAETDSGNITLGKINGSSDIKSDSGNINVSSFAVNKDSSIKTDSGNISIVKTNGAYIDAYSESGSCHYNNSESKALFKLSLNSDSGNIKVNY